MALLHDGLGVNMDDDSLLFTDTIVSPSGQPVALDWTLGKVLKSLGLDWTLRHPQNAWGICLGLNSQEKDAIERLRVPLDSHLTGRRLMREERKLRAPCSSPTRLFTSLKMCGSGDPVPIEAGSSCMTPALTSIGTEWTANLEGTFG